MTGPDPFGNGAPVPIGPPRRLPAAETKSLTNSTGTGLPRETGCPLTSAACAPPNAPGPSPGKPPDRELKPGNNRSHHDLGCDSIDWSA